MMLVFMDISKWLVSTH